MGKDKTYYLGCKILLAAGILYIVIGVFMVLFNQSPIFSILDSLINPLFWDNQHLSQGTLNFKVFTWSFLGMFHIIWGTNIWYVTIYGLLKKKEAWAWRSIFITMVVWLTIDLYFSLSMKLYIIAFNPATGFFILFMLVPLVLTKKVLKQDKKKI